MYESMLFCKPKACLLCVLCSAAFCMQFQLGLTQDMTTVDTSTCNECIKCTHSISQPASTKSDINSFTCEHEPRVKNGSCFLHNEKCLTLQELKNNKDLLKDLDTTLCCVFKNMSSPCNNGGQFKCPNRKDEPVCECLYGFEGERCQEKATQPVVQLCWIVCGYQFTNQCDQINANWTECPTDDGTSKSLENCLKGQVNAIKAVEEKLKNDCIIRYIIIVSGSVALCLVCLFVLRNRIMHSWCCKRMRAKHRTSESLHVSTKCSAGGIHRH